MSVVGISMVKDEIDIISRTIEHMLSQVDHLIVFDDQSTDGTYEAIANFEDVADSRLWLITKKTYFGMEVLRKDGYYQSEKMSALARIAYEELNAKWIIPFDADEIWISQWGTLKDVCESHENTYGIIRAILFDHVATGFDLTAEPDPIERLTYRRFHPLPLPKVACRAAEELVIEQGNHGASYPLPARFTEECPIVVHHYPYRSAEQFIRKVRNGAESYAKTDLPETAGAHWRQWGKFTDLELVELFYKWYWRDNPTVPFYVDGEIQGELIQDKPI